MKYFFLMSLLFMISGLGDSIFGQSYRDLILQCKTKYSSTEGLCGIIKLTSEKDDVISNSAKYTYTGGAKNPNWRLIVLPEYHRYIFNNGSETYTISEDTKTFFIDKDTFAILRFNSYLDNISGIFMTKDIRAKDLSTDTTSNVDIVELQNGIVEIIVTAQDMPEYNISNFTFKMNIDTITKTPLWENTSYLFLGEIVSETAELDSLYENSSESDAAFQKVQQMIGTFKLSQKSDDEVPSEKVFTYSEILKNLTFVNEPPGESKYYLLDLYYVSCAPCLKSVQYLKDLAKGHSKNLLAVIGVNSYDKKERIENYASKYQITYPEAMIENQFVLDKIGHIGYPYFVLFDQEGNIIIRQTGFDPEFFDAVKEIIEQ